MKYVYLMSVYDAVLHTKQNQSKRLKLTLEAFVDLFSLDVSEP